METVRILERAGKDGILNLRIPVQSPETEYEVVIFVQPIDGPATEGGWPPGYFENTAGSIADETFVRQPQGEYSKPVNLE
jgi:hypothetical protein